jgi:hypothetical protein
VFLLVFTLKEGHRGPLGGTGRIDVQDDRKSAQYIRNFQDENMQNREARGLEIEIL